MKRIIRLVGEGSDRPRGVPCDRRSRLSASAALASMLTAASATFALVQSPRAAVVPPADQAPQVEDHLQQADDAYAAAVHAYFRRLHEAAAQGEGSLQQANDARAATALAYFGRLHEAAAQGEGAWLETEDGAFTLEFAGEPGEGVWMLEGHVQADPAAAAEAVQLAAQLRVATVRSAITAHRAYLLDVHGQPVVLSEAAPAIDPEKMPSEGLIRAAQYVYPFDLFSLTPWVDPNAQQVLVMPQVQPFLAQPAEVGDGELIMRLGYYIHAQGALQVQPHIHRLDRAAPEITIELAPVVEEMDVTDAEGEVEAQADGQARTHAVANVLRQLVGENASAGEPAEEPAPPAPKP